MRTSILAVALTCLAAGSEASPFVLTIDGTVSFTTGSAPSLSALGLASGSPLHYEILVDTSADGFYTSGGESWLLPDVWNSPDDHRDNFYAELLSQPYPTPGSYYGWGRELFVGSDVVSPAFSCEVLGRLFVGIEAFHIDGCAPVGDWGVGMSLGSLHGWHDSETDEYVSVFGNLTVTDVTSVPEPTTGLLVALGVALLARRRDARTKPPCRRPSRSARDTRTRRGHGGLSDGLQPSREDNRRSSRWTG